MLSNKKVLYFKKVIILLFLISLFAGMLARYIHKAEKRNFCDFRVYYYTFKKFLNKEDIYQRERPDITPFKYSPFFVFFFSWLGFFSIKEASIIFFCINFLSTFLILIGSLKIISLSSEIKHTYFIILATFILISRFIIQVWDQGQVSLIMLAFILGGLYFLEKDHCILSSLLLAVSINIKYMSLLFLPFFILTRRYREVMWIVLLAVALNFLPALYVGASKNIQYLLNWIPWITHTSLDRGSLFDFKNQSLFSMILRYTCKDSPYKINILNLDFFVSLILGASLSILIYLCIFIKSLEFINWAQILICMALFNPNSWMSNFVFLSLGYSIGIAYLVKIKFKDKITFALLVLSFILCSWGSESIVGQHLEDLWEIYSTSTWGALILFFTLFRVKLNKSY